jgi:hydrogenase-4 component B
VEQLTALALLVLLAASATELAGVPRIRAGYWLSAVAAALALAVFSWALADSQVVAFDLWSPAPSLDLYWRMDALGAFLGALVAVVALFSSVFAVRYSHPRRLDDAVYPLFLLSMFGVAGAGNVFTFFAMWELMALTSFLLVLGDGESHSRRTAALLYVGMAHVATVLAVASLLLLAQRAGSSDFQAMGLADAGSSGRTSLALMFAVAGFGTKAGIMPLHIWLPRAHPVAPSHVSALMSAAMVVTGVYGIVRVGFDFLGPGEPWWGIVVMAIGAVTATLGVLYALMERDAKRCLAYSTVENMGIIMLAVGVGLSFRAVGANEAAAAALLAGLVHAVNHGLLKTLLFLGAGAVQHATHSLDMDRLGGLLRAMPLTGGAMLVGSLPRLRAAAQRVRGRMDAGAQPGRSGRERGRRSDGRRRGRVGLLALTAGPALACLSGSSG